MVPRLCIIKKLIDFVLWEVRTGVNWNHPNKKVYCRGKEALEEYWHSNSSPIALTRERASIFTVLQAISQSILDALHTDSTVYTSEENKHDSPRRERINFAREINFLNALIAASLFSIPMASGIKKHDSKYWKKRETAFSRAVIICAGERERKRRGKNPSGESECLAGFIFFGLLKSPFPDGGEIRRATPLSSKWRHPNVNWIHR